MRLVLRSRRNLVRTLVLVVSTLVAGVAHAATSAPIQCGGPNKGQPVPSGGIGQWQCVEGTITNTGASLLGTAKNPTVPYRDYIIQVTLVHSTLGTSTQDAFWIGGNSFKFRIAFPAAGPSTAATVTWGNVTCQTANSGGPACPTSLSWSLPPGSLTVNPAIIGSGHDLYDRGFLRQYTFYGYSPLYYGDLSQQFYWNGDTAWSAPGYEASGQTTLWGSSSVSGSYIADRRAKGFNVVLVAPAATYQSTCSTVTGPFTTCPTHKVPVPNDASVPNSTYWDKFDTLISTANGADIVPLIAGLVDPLDTAVSGAYPCQRNAVAFSRYLAARMAGFAVMLSPGFDDNPSSTTACIKNPQTTAHETLSDVMNAIGSAVKIIPPNGSSSPQPAMPRVVLTNHLNGGGTCSDYQAFRGSFWMSFFMFQSGHGGNLPIGSPDPPGTACPRANDSVETPVQAALRRSWQMPWTLTYSGAAPALPSYSPVLPAYNGEGPYDNMCLQASPPTCYCTQHPAACSNGQLIVPLNNTPNYGSYVDLRYHNRQAAYESLFSDAYGFTYGVDEIAHWYFAPTNSTTISFSTALLGNASGDMVSIFNHFKTRAGLTAHRDWITNSTPDTADDGNFKKVLASDGSSLVLAYVPAGSATGPTKEIDISTTNMPTLTCPSSTWTYTWSHAQDNKPDLTAVGCTGTNPIAITRPDVVNPGTPGPCSGYDAQACDWVLQIQKTGPASVASQASLSGQTPNVWADMSPGDGTSAIYAQLRLGSGPTAVPVLVSPSGIAFQQSPRVTRVGNGYLVVWHADGLDGSMLGVFAQMLDEHGQPVGSRIPVNTTTEGDQRDPVVDSSGLGNSVIVWTSHGQDGDLGGIYGRQLDSSGTALADEFRVNDVTAGHQEVPQVAYLPGGGFVVAWQTRAMDESPGALSFKIFSGEGSAATPEIRIPGQAGTGLAHRLIDVMPTATGGLRLRWRLIGPDGGSRVLLQQDFDASGQSLGPASSLH